MRKSFSASADMRPRTSDLRQFLGFRVSNGYHNGTTWGGQGDLVSRLIMGITGVIIWVLGSINLLTKFP